MTAAVALGVAIALAFGLALFLRQRSLIFRPPALTRSRTGPDGGARGPGTEPDPGHHVLRLPLADGSAATAWWLPDAVGSRVVLFFHGSDSRLGREAATLRFLRSLGLSVLAVEYPGYEADTGRPSEARCYAAADAAWQFVRHRVEAPADQILLFGVSLGAAVAVYLAHRHGGGGLVVHSGFTSVPDLAARRYPYLPVRPFCLTKMNNLRRIGACACPVLIVHSADDEHIPYRHAERLFAAAGEPKRLITLRGSHFGNRWQGEPAVRDAWVELLRHDLRAWSDGSG